MCYKKTFILTIGFLAHLYAEPSSKINPDITIWVHGTRQFFTKFFCKNYFYCPPGFNKAQDLNTCLHIREIAHILDSADSNRFNIDWFYIFGWSGKLSYQARYKAAEDLYQHLIQIRQDYFKTHNVWPVIRIITHSHGGNVVLNLASVEPNPIFWIDELILLACPVQDQTKEYIKHSWFKQAISLYSKRDTLQVGDPQGLHFYFAKEPGFCTEKPNTLFSKRIFEQKPNVAQLSIQINNSYLSHLGFLRNQFIKLLPSIIEEVRSGNYFGQITTFALRTGTKRLWLKQKPLFT